MCAQITFLTSYWYMVYIIGIWCIYGISNISDSPSSHVGSFQLHPAAKPQVADVVRSPQAVTEPW